MPTYISCLVTNALHRCRTCIASLMYVSSVDSILMRQFSRSPRLLKTSIRSLHDRIGAWGKISASTSRTHIVTFLENPRPTNVVRCTGKDKYGSMRRHHSEDNTSHTATCDFGARPRMLAQPLSEYHSSNDKAYFECLSESRTETSGAQSSTHIHPALEA